MNPQTKNKNQQIIYIKSKIHVLIKCILFIREQKKNNQQNQQQQILYVWII